MCVCIHTFYTHIHFALLMFENNSFCITRARVIVGTWHHPPPHRPRAGGGVLLCIENYVLFRPVPLGNNGPALALLFIQKPKTNMFFLSPTDRPAGWLAPIQLSKVYLLCDLTKLPSNYPPPVNAPFCSSSTNELCAKNNSTLAFADTPA